MEIVIGIIIAAGLFYYFVIKRWGNREFWKIATEYPEVTLHMMVSDEDEAWEFDEEVVKKDKSKYTLPIPFYDPRLRTTVKIYGVHGKYEESQKRILEFLKKYDSELKVLDKQIKRE